MDDWMFDGGMGDEMVVRKGGQVEDGTIGWIEDGMVGWMEDGIFGWKGLDNGWLDGRMNG